MTTGFQDLEFRRFHRVTVASTPPNRDQKFLTTPIADGIKSISFGLYPPEIFNNFSKHPRWPPPQAPTIRRPNRG